MSDPRTVAAADWGERSSFRLPGVTKLDCPDPAGGGSSGGNGSGGGDCGCGCGCASPGTQAGGHARCGHHHGPGGGNGQSCRCGCGHCGRDAEVGADRVSHCRCEDSYEKHDHRSERGTSTGTVLGWKNPRRPARHCGVSTGRVTGGVLTACDFDTPPWNTWPGTRPELYLPYLLMRANAGDLGARPVVGPFWESPDILLLAGVDPAVAPPRPPALGQTAIAGKPNTLYAHVWNFGRSAAPNVVVEFYWCDPSLGIGAAGTHLIGQTEVALGDRGSGRNHAIVKCPVAWMPTFVNGGHECLVVRIWEETSDGLGTPPWDAALNRHVAQRNIHVIAAGEQGFMADLRGRGAAVLLPAPIIPITLKVGPLYGQPAQVAVQRTAPHEMPWLQLRTGIRGQFPVQAVPTGDVVLSAPTTIGGGQPTGTGAGSAHVVAGDDQQVQLTTGDALPAPGQAHVYRVTASQSGQVFGGYTVVLVG